MTNKNLKKKNQRNQKKAERRKALQIGVNLDNPVIGKGSLGFAYSDADVFAPVAKAKAMRMTQGQVLPASAGNIRVRRREYITDVFGSVGFAATVYNINPGLSTTFPWLSSLARNFEKYKFHILRFGYETEVATSTAGSIMQAFEYDVHDPPPINKQLIMGLNGAVRSPAWSPMYSEALREQLVKTDRLIRTADIPPNTDLTLYDVAFYCISTSGLPNTNACGELYVEYDVELMVPNVPSPSETADGDTAVFFQTGNDMYVSGNGEKDGTLPTDYGTNSVTIRQAGEYLVIMNCRYSAASLELPSITLTNGAQYTVLNIAPVVSAASVQRSISYSVVVPDSLGTKITFVRSASPGVITESSVVVTLGEDAALKKSALV